MPFGILRTVVERLHLRKQLMDDAELAREREADRRALGLQQQLFEFAPDALGRQIVESDRRTDPRRVGIDRQLESRRELQRTEDTEGVIREGLRIHDSEDTEFEVLAALKGIEIFVGERIPANRVDGEVAASGGIFERHRRVALDREALVAAAGLRFAARQRHVDGAELVDRERLANRLDAAEGLQQRQQRILRDAEDLHVEVFRWSLQEPIPGEAADAQRAAAGVTHGRGKARRLLLEIHVNSI